MKNLYFLLIIIITISCQENTNQKNDSNNQQIEEDFANDTIQTASGLKYIYLKTGQGRRIEDGCAVKACTKLYVNEIDTVFWSTDNEPDSSITFIQGKTHLIKGSLELYSLLREGDEVIAIIPDSLGYGKKGRGVLPGGATLTFNPIIVKSVSAPKKVFSDTLTVALENGGLEQMISVYDGIANSELKENYHFMSESFKPVLNELWNEKKFKLIEDVCFKLKEHTNSVVSEDIDFWRVDALKEQGKYGEAISLVEFRLEKGYKYTEWAKNYIKELKELQENK